MEIIFYNKETTEGFILNILNKHKVYDMNPFVDGTDLCLEDCESGDVYVNDEMYDFFVDDLFVFTGDNETPDLLTEEEWVIFNKLFHRMEAI